MTVNAFFAFGEEYGWRNFMLLRLRRDLKWGFWTTSLITGTIWGLWHWNIIFAVGHNYPHQRILGIVAMTAFCVSASPLIHHFTEISNTRPFALSAAMMHGILNACAKLAELNIVGGSELTNGVAGVAGWIAFIIAAALILVYRVVVGNNGNEFTTASTAVTKKTIQATTAAETTTVTSSTAESSNSSSEAKKTQ